MVYVGRNQLDGAFLERFRTGLITMDYSSAVEEQIGDREVLAWARAVRRSIRDNGLQRFMSTRTIKKFSEYKKDKGWTIAKMEKRFFAGWSDDEIRPVKSAGRLAVSSN